MTIWFTKRVDERGSNGFGLRFSLLAQDREQWVLLWPKLPRAEHTTTLECFDGTMRSTHATARWRREPGSAATCIRAEPARPESQVKKQALLST